MNSKSAKHSASKLNKTINKEKDFILRKIISKKPVWFPSEVQQMYAGTQHFRRNAVLPVIVLGFHCNLHLFLNHSLLWGRGEAAAPLWFRNGLSSMDSIIRKTPDELLNNNQPTPSALVRSV